MKIPKNAKDGDKINSNGKKFTVKFITHKVKIIELLKEVREKLILIASKALEEN